LTGEVTIEEPEQRDLPEVQEAAGPVPPPDLEIDSLIVGDTAVLRLRGELDRCTAGKLGDVAALAFEEGARNVVADCSDLTFLDAGGLQALVALERQAHRQCGTLVMRHCSELARRIVEITALTSVLGLEAPPPS